MLEEDINKMISDILRTIDIDEIDYEFIDEMIYNSVYYKNNFIDIEENDDVDEDEAEKKNNSLYNEILDKLVEKLEKEYITSRFDEDKDKYVFDYQEASQKGYNELIDYLDDNNINYEISRSTEAGYVPSIYIKDEDGDTIFRIANHDNGYIDDFDMVYNEKYNKIFNDKDYIFWKDNIVYVLNKILKDEV